MRALTDIQARNLGDTLAVFDTYYDTTEEYIALRELESMGLCTSEDAESWDGAPQVWFHGNERGRMAIRIHEAWTRAKEMLQCQ